MVSFKDKRGGSSRLGRYKIPLIVGAVVVLTAVGGLAAWKILQNPVNTEGFQMVKLSSGEMYIGRLSDATSDEYIVLRQAYTQSSEAEKSEESPGNDNEVLLTRLSATLAKPEDVIYISRDKVVYWANLQEDSKIVNVIKNDK